MPAANVEPFVSAFPPPDERLLENAESLKPKLLETRIPVSKVIVVERDESAILGWSKKAAPVDRLEELPLLSSGDQCILDVGEHVTGYLEFGLAGLPHEIKPADAPARIKLTFGEVLNDVAESFEPYKYVVPSFSAGLGAITDPFVVPQRLPVEIMAPRRDGRSPKAALQAAKDADCKPLRFPVHQD